MAPETWPVLDASSWELAGEETQGLHRHPWVRSPSQDRTWLYKQTVIDVDQPLREDMTEKIASEVGLLLGVSCARVELCQRNGNAACLVEDLRWTKGALHPGQLLLSGVLPDYDHEDKEHRGHTPANVKIALAEYAVPPGAVLPNEFGAFDAFCGYLLFDALIANTDRHDGNWAVLLPPPSSKQQDALCGSYDHASSLGFNLSDGKRRDLLAQGRLDAWAKKAYARQFEHIRHTPRKSLVDLAGEALSLAGAMTNDYWLGRLDELSLDDVASVVAAVPDLSDLAVNFTTELIAVNRRRLLDDDRD